MAANNNKQRDTQRTKLRETQRTKLRVLFIVGGLGKGGAEKQFLYMLQALQSMGAEIKVLTLTAGEYHETSLTSLGIQPIFIGENPAVRLVNILKIVRAFRPHFLQASHFFANFYVGLAGRITGITSIGAVRSDLYNDLAGIGRFGPLMVHLPTVLLANSTLARENAKKMRIAENRFFVLPNVIDLNDFDRRLAAAPAEVFDPGAIRVITVARLVEVKRLERMLEALAIARKRMPALQGLIVGGGPEEAKLRVTAEQLGLRPNQPNTVEPRAGAQAGAQAGVLFLGERADIPQLFAQASICVLTSDREGFPNVLLEAMAACLPVLSTRVGEAPLLVREGENGYLIPFDQPEVLADYFVRFAESRALRRSMGTAGRYMVEQQFSFPRLAHNMIEIYRDIARANHNSAALAVLGSGATEQQKSKLPLSENYLKGKP